MSELTDLRQVQRRISQLTAFEDGLFDLFLGIIFLFLSIYPVTRELLGPEWNIALFLALVALAAAGQLLARRLVSQPRIGYVRTRRSRGLYALVIVTVVLVLLTLGLVLLTLLSPAPDSTASLPAEASSGRSYLVEYIVILVMGGLFSAMGYVFGVKRLYFYGWMLGLANLASVYMSHNAGWTFLIPMALAAGILILIGLVRLLRFLQKYSRPAEES